MVRFALHAPNFGEPRDVVALGVTAERAGWDGFFLWDHVFGSPSFAVPMVDPWVVLGALAQATTRIRLGTAVTPLARRRPQKVARETVTVDRLSGGRLVLGVGLGNPPEEYEAFGEVSEPRQLAARLDEALEVLAGLWSGERFDYGGRHLTVDGAQFMPTPTQRPRIPIWVAGSPRRRRPLARAARWDGVILADTTGDGIETVSTDDLRTATGRIRTQRGDMEGFDVAVVHPGRPGRSDVERYAELGATWVLVTGWADQLTELATQPPTRLG
jgi:alkanesulfonate monooxygenase SsuD/methylene tetrahydromethanopterin reductase-like flavin-dependent oxidoreductase (luciferase family)